MLLYGIAVACAVHGCRLIAGAEDTARSTSDDLATGVPWLWMAVFLWILAELIPRSSDLIRCWYRLGRVEKLQLLARLLPAAMWVRTIQLILESMSSPRALTLLAESLAWLAVGVVIWLLIDQIDRRRRKRRGQPALVGAKLVKRDSVASIVWISSASGKLVLLRRIVLLGLAAVASAAVWVSADENRIEPPFIALWLISALLWSLCFVPLNGSVFDWATRKIEFLRRFSWRQHWWVILAFVGVMLLGASFRLTKLDTLPLDMIPADHADDILAGYRISQGQFTILQIKGQAREPMHMYFMALLGRFPGLGFDHFTIKLLAAIESLITLPVLFWMGYELMGQKDRRFGVVTGLMMTGLVAVSYWHVSISRYAMRTHLTVLFAALMMIYLARAMRKNCRSDYIKLGLCLGFSLYAYTPCKMLPLVAVCGIGLALLVRRISWYERLHYIFNLAVAGLICLMVYLPMHHTTMDYPDETWRNSLKEVFGTTPGQPIDVDPADFVSGFMRNIGDSLHMFHWVGDGNWIQAATLKPALDIYTGAFLILGLASGGVYLLQHRRDPVLWLMPVMIIIMLLPSAMSVAHSITNPSHTLTSGAIPGVYLIAALPVVTLAFRIARSYSGHIGKLLAAGLCVLVLLFANQHNGRTYFDIFPRTYGPAPFRHAGNVVRGLVDSGVDWGNIVIIVYPHFWDERNVYIEAGEPAFYSAAPVGDLPRKLESAWRETGEYRLDPGKDLIFIYPPEDEDSARQLQDWFPDGRALEIQSYLPEDHWRGSYVLFRVPYLGESGLWGFLEREL